MALPRPTSNASERAPASLAGLFRWDGPIGPRRYALVGICLMALKYAVDAAALYWVAGVVWTPLDYLSPLRLQSRTALREHLALEVALLAWMLPFVWIGATLTIRRAVDAGMSGWFGLFFFVPFVNYVLMVVLCFASSREDARALGEPERPDPLGGDPEGGGGGEIGEPLGVPASLRTALGVAAVAVVITVLGVAFSVNVFQSYGAALFLGSPFFIGVIAGVVHNGARTQSVWGTLAIATAAIVVAGGCLLLIAAEGAICIAMVFPIALPPTWAGALIGRGMAMFSRGGGGRSQIAPGFGAMLVLIALVGVESRVREPEAFRVVTTIEVDAPPEVVWRHVVAFSELPPPSAWVFRLGIAYPVRARIEGEGVGAVRRCEFSTGAFVEPITVWDEPRRLAFDVAEQPPPMHELSPYEDLHPPHLDGYLRSVRGEFLLTPIEAPDGSVRTRLSGTTWYELDLHPAGYWRLWSDALIHRIHGRVLRHVAALSEAG